MLRVPLFVNAAPSVRIPPTVNVPVVSVTPFVLVIAKVFSD